MFEALRLEQHLGKPHVLPGPWELAWEAEHLEGSQPQEILEWAVETYGSGLALSASFGGVSNVVLIGGDNLADAADLNEALRRWDTMSVAITGTAVETFIGEANVLSDDFAPVDLLLRRT